MAIQDELPRSRITLTYRTTINGEPETVKLPLRLLILGDFSHGTSADRVKRNDKGEVTGEVDLEARRMRSINGGNIDSVMKDMNISLTLKDGVQNWIDPDKGGTTMPITLPISKMKSFHPDEIVKHVPKLSALLLLRKLLEEMQSTIDNRKELRKTIYEIFSKEEERQKILKDLETHKTLALQAGTASDKPVTPPAAT